VATYNVLDEPWIEVLSVDGQTSRLGLLETLATAHDLASVVDPSPLFRCGIQRLLVAFVMDAFWLEQITDLEDLLQGGEFPLDLLQTYVHRVGRSHFDLFDAEHPFLQSAPMQGIEDPAPDHIVRLVQHLPSGTFATHFFHAQEDTHAFSPAVCVRALAAVAPFMTAGGAGFSPSVNGMPPWYVLVRGRNLFETLLLNSCPLDLWEEDPTPPAWRREEPVIPRQERQCTSPLEALTWQPRRIRLVPGDGGVCTYCGQEVPILVRRAVFGHGFRSTGGWQDPHVAYRYTAKGPSPLRPQEGRPLWQDTGPLLLLRQEDFEGAGGKVRYQRPYVVQQRQQLVMDGLIERRQPIQVEASGLRTDGKMKIFEWQREALSLPAEVFLDPRSPAQVQEAIEAAARIDFHLKRATRMLYPRDGGGNAKAFESLFRRLEEAYWGDLHAAFVDVYLPLLVGQDPGDVTAPEDLRIKWAEVLTRVARKGFDAHVDGLDADGDALRRLVEARRYLAKTTAPKHLP